MAVIEDLQDAVKKVASEVGSSVVGIANRWAMGSGVVVEPGKVLTNAHNIRSGEVAVTFADGSTGTGRATGVDVDGDIAVVAVDTGDVAPIDWSNGSSELEIGSSVFALSNPGGRGLRVTFGLVSGTQRSFRGPRGRRIGGSVEHTAPLLPGSSGGPIVDGGGSFLGLNTNRLGEGFYLAIPAGENLKRSVAALSQGRSAKRPRLGVGLAPSHVAQGLRRAVGLPEIEGLLVRVVEEGGPAAAAGIAEGDLITDVGGRAIASADDLYDVLGGWSEGPLEITLVRGTEERKVKVTPSSE